MFTPLQQNFDREGTKHSMGRKSGGTAKTAWTPTIRMTHALKSWNSRPFRNHVVILILPSIPSHDGLKWRVIDNRDSSRRNPHQLLIMFSSRSVSELLDSPMCCQECRDKTFGETKCQRRVLPLTPSCTCASSCGYCQPPCCREP